KLQEMNEGKSKSRSVLTNDYSKEPQSGLWYPSRSIYEVTHNERLIERVETVAQEINFSNVDDDTFTVDAIPLQEGTVVRNMVPGAGPTRGSVVDGKVEFPVLRERSVALPFDPAAKSGRGRF